MLEIIQCYWMAFLLGAVCGFFLAAAFTMARDYEL
jgi:hypothetical protein